MGFKDGGIRGNNPLGAAWGEFLSLYGDRGPALLLSIGTSRKDISQDGFAASWPGPSGNSWFLKKVAEKSAIPKTRIIKFTEGEEKQKAMKLVARGEHRWYKRLNVSAGLEAMKLDDWESDTVKDPESGLTKVIPGGKSLKRTKQATEAYLERPIDKRCDSYAPPSEMILQSAEILVRHRQLENVRASGEGSRTTKRGGKHSWGSFSPGHGQILQMEYWNLPDDDNRLLFRQT